MSAGTAARFGRTAAESLMRDECSVTYLYGDPVKDPETGKETRQSATRLTSKCKVQVSNVSLSVRDTSAGGTLTAVARAEIHLPYYTQGVQPGDLITITSIGPETPQSVLGRKFRVAGYNPKSYATALKLQVEDVL